MHYEQYNKLINQNKPYKLLSSKLQVHVQRYYMSHTSVDNLLKASK